jgi:DnaJ-domain-containing protein 1
MTLIELGVIALGLFLGYWAVSTFLFPSRPKQPESHAQPNATSQSAPPPRRAPRADWNEVLSVPPTATTTEIRDAYRRLISQYHPDKVNNLGQEFRDLATRKSQEITTAYAQALRERGEQP